MWTLDDGVAFLRALDPLVRLAGYSTALTGSVLHKGSSVKDLDIVLFPLGNVQKRPTYLREILVAEGMQLVRDVCDVRAGWRQHGSTDTKFVEEWSYDGKRIDLFFLE